MANVGLVFGSQHNKISKEIMVVILHAVYCLSSFLAASSL